MCVFFFFSPRWRERAEIETLLGWRAVSYMSTQLLLENSAPCPTKPPGVTRITRMAEPSTADALFLLTWA